MVSDIKISNKMSMAKIKSILYSIINSFCYSVFVACIDVRWIQSSKQLKLKNTFWFERFGDYSFMLSQLCTFKKDWKWYGQSSLECSLYRCRRMRIGIFYGRISTQLCNNFINSFRGQLTLYCIHFLKSLFYKESILKNRFFRGIYAPFGSASARSFLALPAAIDTDPETV